MSKLTFNSNERPTVGIELELGLVDGQTMELSSSIEAVLTELPDDGGACFKPELMQSAIEINTCICTTIDEAERDLRGKLAVTEGIADRLGLQLWWGATHPFSHWADQKVTPDERYEGLVEVLQEM